MNCYICDAKAPDPSPGEPAKCTRCDPAPGMSTLTAALNTAAAQAKWGSVQSYLGSAQAFWNAQQQQAFARQQGTLSATAGTVHFAGNGYFGNIGKGV